MKEAAVRKYRNHVDAIINSNAAYVATGGGTGYRECMVTAVFILPDGNRPVAAVSQSSAERNWAKLSDAAKDRRPSARRTGANNESLVARNLT